MKTSIRLLLAVIVIVAASCRKTDAIGPVVASSVDVYVAGTSTVNGKAVTTYWKNGVATTLSGESAVGITVNGADVYIAGNDTRGGMYWKNGIATRLYAVRWEQGITYGPPMSKITPYISAIAVKGNDVYTAGIVSDGYNPTWTLQTYWKNDIAADTMIFVYGHGRNSYNYYLDVSAIAVQGNDVYTAGSQSGGPYLRKNKTVTYLSEYGSATVTGIAVQGNDVFVAGTTRIFGRGSGLAAFYSKNDIYVALPDGSLGSAAYAITVQGGDVYIAGNVAGKTGKTQGTYWKNSTPTTIPDCNNVVAIAVQGSDVYVAGHNLAGYAAYWKNGVEAQLTNGSNLSDAVGIAVVPH